MTKINKKETWWQETINTPVTEVVEENFFIDEKFVKNKELIRIDMNIVQFPIFSKNTKRKVNQIIKYFFNKNRDTSITITPTAGNYIPGEMEEKVFIALMQIMKEKNMPRKFMVTGTELRDKLKLNTIRYGNIIKNALLRLSETNYNFKNTMYSSEQKGILNKEISTSILDLEIITLSLKENKKYREIYEDNRIKEIYEITISDHFYKNIIQKGYMVYNSIILLEISTSTARTIYMLIEKLRFDNLELKIDTMFLIKRIPLKFDKRNIVQTIRTLEKAFNELQSKNLISSFNFIKDSTWENSEIKIYFPETANEEKQGRFFNDKNDWRKILTSTTISNEIHEIIEEEIEVISIDKKENIEITRELIDKILGLMPSKARDLKTMPKTIKEAIEHYGYNKVESVAIYMKKNKVEKVRAYFLKALENNWIEEVEIMDSKPVIKSKKEFELPFETNISKYNESLYIEFEKLEIEIQNGIEAYAYREYVQECGMDTKIQKLAFKASRKKYICEFLERYPEILGDLKQEKNNDKVEEKDNDYMLDLNEIKDIINRTLDMASMLNNYTEENKKDILRTILKELMPDIKKLKLTNKKLDDILNKYIIF